MAERSDGTVAEAYIRILHTRGIGDLTYDPAATPTPSVVVIVKPLPKSRRRTVRDAASRSAWSTSSATIPRSVNPLIKSNNLLNNALCMQEALRKGGVEGVFRNYRGELSECSQSNLFIVTGWRRAHSAARGRACLPASHGASSSKSARALGITVEEAALRDDDLFGADEAFFTSTTKELMPIVQVDDRTIGSGKPGAMTGQLLAEYRRRANQMTTAVVR